MSDPISKQRERLGTERLEQLMVAMAHLHGHMTLLIMSLSTAPALEYADEYLDTLRDDADDVAGAAMELRKVVLSIADHWRAQREEFTR
jgi:hypothetical protein